MKKAIEKKEDKKKVVAYLGDGKLELSTPLNVNGKEINVINLREPKVKDLKAVSHIHNDLEQTSTLIANISGFTLEEIEEFPSHIYMRLQDLVKPFLS
ncbi:phage tail assembly protein [Arcobacter cryaerophilus gv. pseudocryaerophilus]|uniref:Phage tail assembly protein n=3 Tax=Arcobacteraceae TaxID=2808963 RepID=A0AA96IJA5_9BACT|nr:phage tail assembly protein [Arcobacter sp. AZ-2023]WNL36453.1 phage tail assembly protein [Arcobacter sp. AZ-2023]WPD12169.1 phage tail assembly protein [Arcobacter sp. DSM 115960]